METEYGAVVTRQAVTIIANIGRQCWAQRGWQFFTQWAQIGGDR